MRKRAWVAFCLAASMVSLQVRSEEGPRLRGLLQAWTFNDTSSALSGRTQFRVRRAELAVSGEIGGAAIPARYLLKVDAAKSLRTGAISSTNDNKVLQDVLIALGVSSQFELAGGQFKTPTTAEGLESSAELLFPERSLTARTFGDRREPGISLTWKAGETQAVVMLSNGQATNVEDTNHLKDLHLRVETSVCPQLSFGAFTSAGDLSYGSKGRWGMNTRASWGDWTARAEAVYATDSSGTSQGIMGDLSVALGERWLPAVRFEQLRQRQSQASLTTLGFSYRLAAHRAKIQVAGGWLSGANTDVGSPRLAAGAGGSLITLAMQAAF